jgi:hypothetical protein
MGPEHANIGHLCWIVSLLVVLSPYIIYGIVTAIHKLCARCTRFVRGFDVIEK